MYYLCHQYLKFSVQLALLASRQLVTFELTAKRQDLHVSMQSMSQFTYVFFYNESHQG